MTQQELTQYLEDQNQLTQVMNYIQSGDTAGLDSWAKAHNLPIGAQKITEILGSLSEEMLQGVSGGGRWDPFIPPMDNKKNNNKTGNTPSGKPGSGK